MFSETEPKTAGSQGSKWQNATSESLTLCRGAVEWIASQRDSLAKISAPLEKAQVSAESEADCSLKSQEQLTLFGPDTSSLKTAHLSEPEAATSSSANWWRGDIPGATEKLERVTLAHHTSATDGFCLLPTLTVDGNRNRKSYGGKSGDGIATALNKLPTLTANSYGSNQGGAAGRTGKKRKSLAGMLPTLMAADGEKNSINTKDSRGTGNYYLTGRIARLPTLCASDYKSPYSEAGYKKQRQKRSKPLRDTLEHTTGHRLSATVAEWFMGFPLNHTASAHWVMRKYRSKRQRRG